MSATTYRPDATYRAACWLSDDQQSEIVLTTPEESSLPHGELLAAAHAEAAAAGIDISTGRIVVSDWRES